MGRRELREHIFCMLFSKEFYKTEEEVNEQIGSYLENLSDEKAEAEAELSAEDRSYMEKKVESVLNCVPDLDEKINAVAKGWKTNRMSKVDLTIIRLAVYEMLFDESIPEKVAINEAVELAKKFGGDDSTSFVNGILAKVTKENA